MRSWPVQSFFVDGVKGAPGLLIAVILNLMLAVPFGLAFFPAEVALPVVQHARRRGPPRHFLVVQHLMVLLAFAIVSLGSPRHRHSDVPLLHGRLSARHDCCEQISHSYGRYQTPVLAFFEF